MAKYFDTKEAAQEYNAQFKYTPFFIVRVPTTRKLKSGNVEQVNPEFGGKYLLSRHTAGCYCGMCPTLQNDDTVN